MYLIKVAWAVFHGAYILLRIPFWCIYFLHPSLRQHPQWTYRQALRVRLFRSFIYLLGFTHFSPPLSLEPGKEGERFVVIDPARKDLYVDILTCDESIKPEHIGATWYPSLPTSKYLENCDVVLHFHGGGYTLGDGRPTDCGFAASLILQHTPAKYVLCPQYRLSSCSRGRFPAAFQDALTSYSYLLHVLHVPAERVILSGDSAGGHMVIQLLRYISSHNLELGMKAPRVAWVWSPWCDTATPLTDPTIVYRTPQFSTDFLPDHRLPEWTANVYPPHPFTGVPVTHPYVSPLGHPFTLPCPVFAMAGGAELNFKEVREWCEEMKSVEENKGLGFRDGAIGEKDVGSVELWVEEYAPHDVFKCGNLLGFEREARRGVERARVFTWGDEVSLKQDIGFNSARTELTLFDDGL